MNDVKTDLAGNTIETKPGEMSTVTAVLEKLRIKKRDKEFRMTAEGFTAGNGKYYNPEDLKNYQNISGLKVNLIHQILRSFMLLKLMMA
ncbi:MAG: hypothetical protein WKF59_18240 [Chitinophagaceae bacterium]